MNLKLLRSRTKRSPFRSGWRTISLCVLLWGGFASDGQTKELTAKEIIKKSHKLRCSIIQRGPSWN